MKYTFETLSFPTGRPGETVSTIALRFREMEDVRGDANGIWEYLYNFPGPDLSNETKIFLRDSGRKLLHIDRQLF